MIQTEDFYKNMLVNLQDVSPYDSHIEKYERILGLNSVWLLPSLGSLLLFMGFYPLMLIAYFLLFLLNKCWPYVGRLKIKLKDIVFWNWPIQFLNESFIVIVINCLINIKYASWQVKEAALNSGLSYALLALVFVYPVFMQTFLYRRRNMLTNPSFLRRFAAAYKNLDER